MSEVDFVFYLIEKKTKSDIFRDIIENVSIVFDFLSTSLSTSIFIPLTTVFYLIHVHNYPAVNKLQAKQTLI